jgi:hypothetical protein
MRRLNEYNVKSATEKEFNDWYSSYIDTNPMPDSIKEYILDRIESSTDKMDAFYKKCMGQQ